MAIGDSDSEVYINGEEIEHVEQFKYLGSIKSRNGDCTQDIRARIAMAKRRTQTLTPSWKNRGIHKAVKLSVVRALIWPVLTYGSEAWTLTETNMRRIEAAELWTYRRILRISWRDRRTNESVLNEMGVQRELLAMIKHKKLSYFGHAYRGGGLVKDT